MKPEKFYQQDRPTPDQNIDNGIANTEIPDIWEYNISQNQETYKKLLQPLIKDSQILHIISQPDNMVKITYRIQYTATLEDETGSTIAKLKHTGQKTLTQVIQDLKNNLIKGQHIQYPEDLDHN